MAAGVPVVAYDMPSGPRDQIDDGVDGLLVTQGSRARLAAGLLRLATDPAERARMGAAAVAKAATWDSATITAQWERSTTTPYAAGAEPTGRSIGLLTGTGCAGRRPRQRAARPRGRRGDPRAGPARDPRRGRRGGRG